METKKKYSQKAFRAAIICLGFALLLSVVSTFITPVRVPIYTLHGTFYDVRGNDSYEFVSMLSKTMYVVSAIFAVIGYRYKKSAQSIEALETKTGHGQVINMIGSLVTFEFDNGERKQFTNDCLGIFMVGDVGEIQIKGDYIISFVKK